MRSPLSFLVLATALALGACDNNTEPMKANTDAVNKNPQVDQDARPKSTTGGDQPATVPNQ
ncbi:hypothetical protein NKI77_13080 [Mesorhizobium opportunistum]|uniref:Immunogenic protein (Bcsp31-1) n=1 Tax=Mesorhizobium opportunistum TaxID=593909 RepID=A0ABV1YL78_9HYPH|nr:MULTISPECIES: hypothetical protein [Mesorhizobium]TIN93477.1 MAG: hypothetical protein E5Y06_19730 [Mesorhizobium sp.]TJU96558.1 MAG: hypothetical protein E5Y08_21045 [Mesorhizobium sp.]TJV15774.1 MAG: hypothetical protein E5Y07_20895 [Mesorhizobium sp.]WJI41775.1 hypothetical protein NL534_16630 [Mesorhizobium opportunistum]